MAPDANYEIVKTEHCNSALLIPVDNLPINALEVEVRRGLVTGIDVSEPDTVVATLLIDGARRNFIAGVDTPTVSHSPKPSPQRPSTAMNSRSSSSSGSTSPHFQLLPHQPDRLTRRSHALIEDWRSAINTAIAMCIVGCMGDVGLFEIH